MTDNVSWLHQAAGATGMKRYACPTCGEPIVATRPINVLFLCTLCEVVLVESDQDE